MDDDDDWDGVTEGRTVYVRDGEHPILLGPDGKKLRVSNVRNVGFDLSKRRRVNEKT